VVLLTHPHLAERYAAPILEGLRTHGLPVHLLTLPAGERTKNLTTAARCYDRLLALGLDRRSLLVTLGGGVLGDLGGFLAATYLRGIDYVQVPTTLLAQVDASVGGKTGVDLRGGKNLVGAFHQPRAVLIDTETLKTLPMRELRSGIAEVLKYGIIHDKDFFVRVTAELPRLLQRDPTALTETIVRSCEIKAYVVGQDETEQGLRAILNFGHTVGHALEAVTEYRRYKHGEAIAIGMVSAALIGEEAGVTPVSVTQAMRNSLRAAGLPTAFPEDVSLDAILAAMARDKKAISGTIHFVLATRIGEVVLRSGIQQETVRKALLRQRDEK
jgi:3-dehydroquinate synthase